MKQLSKVLVVAGSLLAFLLSALPAFAMRIESNSLPAKTVLARSDSGVSSDKESSKGESNSSESHEKGSKGESNRRGSHENASEGESNGSGSHENVSEGESSGSSSHKNGSGGESGGQTGVKVEFEGKISELVGSGTDLTMTVGSYKVITNNETKIRGTMVDGAYVEVEGYQQTTLEVIARKIAVEDRDDHEVEFHGKIETLPPLGVSPTWIGDWKVGQFIVKVNELTKLNTEHGVIEIGAIAEVKAYRQADKSLLAVRIKIEDTDDFENEFECEGLISGLSGTTNVDYKFIVDGFTVTTDTWTQISGTLVEGMKVEVNGSLQTDGSVLATKVKMEDD